MSPIEITQRVVITVLAVGSVYMILGGGFVHHETLPDRFTRTSTFTLYKTLLPPPRGPAFCDFLTVGSYALNAPCDFKPPFVDWLQGKRT